MNGFLTGEPAALVTAFCWTITALSFEAAGRRIGSLAVNLIRLVLAFLFLAAFSAVVRGRPLPTDAGAHAWLWLSVSGVVGFTLGDMALFRAFVLIGARRAMLLMALVPVLTALTGWLAMGEVLSPADWAGMALTVGGVSLVVSERKHDENAGPPSGRSTTGVLLGLVGAVGQAAGLILSKYGMGDYDPFAATQIRVIAGIGGFSLLYLAIGWWPKVLAGSRDRPAMARVALGAFFGPFLGVSFSLMAVQHAKAGVAATIMAITPVLILAPAAILFKERITPRAVLGAVIAVGGVAVLFA
jgi:drug/metabolite transporter (DMT)-like permease